MLRARRSWSSAASSALLRQRTSIPSSLPNHPKPHSSHVLLYRRAFQSAAEYESWSQRIVASRKQPSNSIPVSDGTTIAPFLCDVNPFAEQRLQFARLDGATPGTSSYATIETTWPIATDSVLAKDVNDLHSRTGVRLGKFYEALDALTADAAYRHTDDGHSRGLVLVTAGHYGSRKLARTRTDADVTIRSYPTLIGNSSLEVRTDAIQNGKLVNFCHTVMVCVDAKTLKPRKGMIPPLIPDPDDVQQEERAKLAVLNNQIRRQRASSSVSLFSRELTHPPNDEEMREIHEMHRNATQNNTNDNNNNNNARPSLATTTTTVGEHTHNNTLVIFPEQRNVHGKTFGGFVMGQAYDFAYMAATCYMRDKPFFSLGLDEASFLQPITVGDLVHFQCRVIHADPEAGVFRVSVNVDVLDKSAGRSEQDSQHDGYARSAASAHNRTNYLRFVFYTAAPIAPLLPVTYSEILGHVNAARRHALEPVAASTLLEYHTD